MSTDSRSIRSKMHIVEFVLQVIVALALLYVWLFRFGKRTEYRGGDSQSMRGEFAAYGLPGWAMYLVGALKVGIAACLLAGVWFPRLVMPAAVLLCGLMVGALAMHLKIHDAAKKSMPALGMLAMSVALVVLSK